MSATAKQEIANFLASKENGVVSSFSKNTLLRAAESMFTANGLICPIVVVDVKGETYIISREAAIAASTTSNGKVE